MFLQNLPPLFLFLFSLFLWQTPALAAQKSYIVYMGEHTHHGSKLTEADLQRVSESHIDFLEDYLGCKNKAKQSLFYSYRRRINGFAATLNETCAARIAKHPKVISVFENKERELHTTNSWSFLDQERNGVVESDSLWRKANFGENIIIGTLDSGVWPESPSFSDAGYGPIPSRWFGICQKDVNVTFPCNRKLIGAKYFYEGYREIYPELTNYTSDSPRDIGGHGSHTLSTAGGNFVAGASVLGIYNGTVKGGAPRARVASYKVCWPAVNKKGGCMDADIIKAFDHAIYDGVDVISVSLGGSVSEYFNDGTAIGAFHAMKHNIPVITSGGNSGPADKTVSNVAPWLITVAASTINREFQNYVQLINGLKLQGLGLTKATPEGKYYPLLSASGAKVPNATITDALLCKPGTLDPEKVKGKILVCLRGDNDRGEKSHVASLAGAEGMILCNDKGDGDQIVNDPHELPAAHLKYTDGLAIFSYINSTSNPLGRITGLNAVVGPIRAPIMANFSSKGPNNLTEEILKPDITAPGVDIMAAYTGAKSPSDLGYDKRRTSYYLLSGTSMACPHVSGIVALLKAIHPDWNPAAIRSALMTTATTLDNTKKPFVIEGTLTEQTPFSYGAGHIRPNLAADPGLVYDIFPKDYARFLCTLGYNATMIQKINQGEFIKCPKISKRILDLNYPSITVPNLFGSITVTRKVTNVGGPGNYVARIVEPSGISVIVKPKLLKFNRPGQRRSFRLSFTRKDGTSIGKGYVFGELVWSDGKHNVRSPLVVST